MEPQNEQIERIEEGFTGATVPDLDPGGSIEKRQRGRPRKAGSDPGDTASRTANPDTGAASAGGSSAGVGDTDDAPKQRRGRKPRDGASAEFCALVVPAGSLLISSGFAAVGKTRGKAVRQKGYPSECADAVASCWEVPYPLAVKVAEPAARILDRMLPPAAKKLVGQAADPLALAEAVWSIASHCMESEQRVLQAWIAKESKPPISPLDGKLPLDDQVGLGLDTI